MTGLELKIVELRTSTKNHKPISLRIDSGEHWLEARNELTTTQPLIYKDSGSYFKMRNEGTSFALKTARPSRGSDDHVKWWSRLQ